MITEDAMASSFKKWADSKSVRDLDKIARRSVEKMCVSWNGSVLLLPNKIELKLTEENEIVTVSRGQRQIFSFQGNENEIRVAVHTEVLEEVRSLASPLISLEDFLDLLISLPWIDSESHVVRQCRLALLEDLLVDQCDKESLHSDDDDETQPKKKKHSPSCLAE